jgi:hypothetical protein
LRVKISVASDTRSLISNVIGGMFMNELYRVMS